MEEPTNVDAAKYEPYLRAARRRVAAEQRSLDLRYKHAWLLARQVAFFLREHYAAQRVVLFGSLLDRARFTTHSDVDLAVWDIPWPEYLHALGDVLDWVDEIEIDLVDVTCCSPQLRGVIEREGIEL
jgi:predicted nucleotidyltransferase